MTDSTPTIVVVGGPNGAGKSTVAPGLLGYLGVEVFVNADSIAQGLSAFRSERREFEASRLLLLELNHLADSRQSFAFESTLASRTLAPWIRGRIAEGYAIVLAYVWVRSADIAVQWVAARVRAGGHGIPEATIRRRFGRSARNLRELYIPLAQRWYVYDNSEQAPPRRIADGGLGRPTRSYDNAAQILLDYP